MYCVIMGDIINSRQMDEQTLTAFTAIAKNTFGAINIAHQTDIVSPFGLVRGDAFEGVLRTPVFAPDIIQTVIKAFYRVNQTKVRIAVSVGELFIVSPDRNESNGPAFHRAAEELERLKNPRILQRRHAAEELRRLKNPLILQRRHWLQVSFTSTSTAQPIIQSLFGLLSALTQRWTARQRQIVWAMQDSSNDIRRVSDTFSIPASVVRKQLAAANYTAYQAAWVGLQKHFMEEAKKNEV